MFLTIVRGVAAYRDPHAWCLCADCQPSNYGSRTPARGRSANADHKFDRTDRGRVDIACGAGPAFQEIADEIDGARAIGLFNDWNVATNPGNKRSLGHLEDAGS